MIPEDCATCRREVYCGYPEGVWFPYKAICFCRIQNWWIIYYLNLLREGRWPVDPRATGYTDASVPKQHNNSCPFANAATVAAEVDLRLARTGIAGKLLVEQVLNNHRIEDLDYEARQALNYISGPSARKLSFSEWKKLDRKRAKVTTKRWSK